MKPFLKWAGNKIHIIAKVQEQVGQGTCLVEPFVGSGAVFLNTEFDSYILCDRNQDLIDLYTSLKLHGQEFIDFCRPYFQSCNNNEERFYELRERFNARPDMVTKSALLLYLNRHCYNGLIRYNLAGLFNTPFGRYKSTYFPELEMQAFLEKSHRATFLCQDFETTMVNAPKGSVIYCDPPYSPISKTANFTSYSSDRFGPLEQMRLVKIAWIAARHGSRVVISNHATDFTAEAYQGMKIVSFPVQRNISCKGHSRNKVLELLAVTEPSG